MVNNPPVDVQQYGQSIWYDNISRGLLRQGEIQRLVDEDGVMGITSNPTIFMNAIAAGTDYDAAILPLAQLSPYEIYEHLAIEDIQAAADILRPVYERTHHVDGYISLEVSPLISDDTQTTLNEALRLFKKLDRPNAMIKIPATEAGLPAIEEAIAAGVNVNITLIFSVENYRQVAERYICGLERRLAQNQDVRQVASVASYFISRIDHAVDQQLQNQGSANPDLLGKTAIANAKNAYRAFKELFEGERFRPLREAGAMVQRPLWASTGTKNPAYPDTLYLDSLIGSDTVNTVPPATLKAFKDHGTVAPTLENDLDQAQVHLEKLAQTGINLEQVNRTLQVDGVNAFIDSFEKLLTAVEGKAALLKVGSGS